MCHGALRYREELYGYIEANPAKAGLCLPGERLRWTWFKPLDAATGQAEARPSSTRDSP
jgi:hypothetical protein